MSLSEELGFRRRLVNEDHEALLGILVTAEMLKKESNRLFAPLGITGAQFNVLILLFAQTEDGTMSQSDLGRLLTVHRSNVTGLVDRLEAQGLVRRLDDPRDRRVYRVALTEEGRETARRSEEIYLGRIHALMGGLTPQEWRSLSSALGEIRARVREG
jgi:MarR family 2-MHQ and catechol resistance regulon transcriptional repressor